MVLKGGVKMLSPVSSLTFGNSSNINSLIHRSGKFSQKPSQHVAPSGEKPEKEMSAGVKTLIGIVLACVATAAYLGYSVKSGNLKKNNSPEGITDRIKNLGFNIGEKVKNGYESFIKLCENKPKTTDKNN